jgi:hypothetical protein
MQIFFKILCTDRRDMPNSAAAFLVDFPGLLCMATLRFDVLWGPRARQNLSSSLTPSPFL